MQGKIIKGIAGFYYVFAHSSSVQTDTEISGMIYECKAKGIFRKDNIKPLVGDDVMIDVLDEESKKGNIMKLLPRRNELIRPAVANIDQALVIFSIVKPEPNFNLLDRFLIMMERQGLKSIICFNKQDIATEEEIKELGHAYEACGYQVLFVSATENQGIKSLLRQLDGKTTAVAGPSGVGKSSIINRLNPDANMEIGEISVKIERGKHTTRHSELIALNKNTYIMDTPGFTSLKLLDIEKEKLTEYYPEFIQYEPYCKFAGCAHINEPGCRVKEALQKGEISQVRYHNYKLLYEELKEQKKY